MSVLVQDNGDHRSPVSPIGSARDIFPTLRMNILGEPDRILAFAVPFRIGRAADCEVSIKNDYVSRVHAEVVFEKGAWCIRDLNSSNGLYLDGRRVEEAVIAGPLRIRLGVDGPEISFDPVKEDIDRKKPPDLEFPGASPPVVLRDPGSGTMLR